MYNTYKCVRCGQIFKMEIEYFIDPKTALCAKCYKEYVSEKHGTDFSHLEIGEEE